MTDGEILYKLIEKVMAETFGPTGRASHVTWEEMDGSTEEMRQRAREMGYPSERAAWEEIARRFRAQ